MSEPSADGFLARWSRRKALVREGGQPVEPPAAATAAPALRPPSVPVAAVAPLPAPQQAPVPDPGPATGRGPVDEPPGAPEPGPPPAALTLADVARLTPQDDFAPFVAPGVDASVRNAALKTLFSDPHFNVMDGLDTYIEDYGLPDPIPRAMLRQMVQSEFLGLFRAETEAAPDTASAAPAGAQPDPAATAAGTPPAACLPAPGADAASEPGADAAAIPGADGPAAAHVAVASPLTSPEPAAAAPEPPPLACP